MRSESPSPAPETIPAQPFTEAERAAVYRAIHERRDMRHFCGGEVPQDVLLRLSSFSKSYAIPGHRLGSLIAGAAVQTQLGKALKVPMFMANMAQQVCEMGRAAGLGHEDGAAIVKVYEQLAHVALASVES